jgi:hypothetical protein
MDVAYVYSYAFAYYWLCFTFALSPISVYYIYATVIAEQFDMALVLQLL